MLVAKAWRYFRLSVAVSGAVSLMRTGRHGPDESATALGLGRELAAITEDLDLDEKLPDSIFPFRPKLPPDDWTGYGGLPVPSSKDGGR